MITKENFNQWLSDIGLKQCLPEENKLAYIASFTPAIYWLEKLYCELVIENEISALSSLPEQTKKLYWKIVSVISKEKKWLKVMAARAIYTFEKLNQNAD